MELIMIYILVGIVSNLIINQDIKKITEGLFSKISKRFMLINSILMGIGIIYYGYYREDLKQTSEDLIYILERVEGDEEISDDFAKHYLSYKRTMAKFRDPIIDNYIVLSKDKILSSSKVSSKIKQAVKSGEYFNN